MKAKTKVKVLIFGADAYESNRSRYSAARLRAVVFNSDRLSAVRIDTKRKQSDKGYFATKGMTGMLSDEMVNRQVDMLLGVEETQQAGHDSVTVDMVELTNQQPRATTGDDPRLDPLAKNPGREVLMRPGENKMPGRNDDVPGQDLLAHASQPAASQSKLQMLPFKVLFLSLSSPVTALVCLHVCGIVKAKRFTSKIPF